MHPKDGDRSQEQHDRAGGKFIESGFNIPGSDLSRVRRLSGREGATLWNWAGCQSRAYLFGVPELGALVFEEEWATEASVAEWCEHFSAVLVGFSQLEHVPSLAESPVDHADW